MSLKPNPREMNIILNILKGAQFEFLPRAPFYIDTPLSDSKKKKSGRNPQTGALFQDRLADWPSVVT
jgi:hypothetical protein